MGGLVRKYRNKEYICILMLSIANWDYSVYIYIFI